MGKKVYTEKEYREAIVTAQMEATKAVVKLFDDAYILGLKHAKALVNGDAVDTPSKGKRENEQD